MDMGWKCLPQVTGLVRGEPKPGAKHRSNGAAICGEAGKERHSASALHNPWPPAYAGPPLLAAFVRSCSTAIR